MPDAKAVPRQEFTRPPVLRLGVPRAPQLDQVRLPEAETSPASGVRNGSTQGAAEPVGDAAVQDVASDDFRSSRERDHVAISQPAVWFSVSRIAADGDAHTGGGKVKCQGVAVRLPVTIKPEWRGFAWRGLAC